MDFVYGLSIGFVGGVILTYLYVSKMIAAAKAEAVSIANSVAAAAAKKL